MEYSSKLIEKAVDAFASLPGIGKKTALRLSLFLLNNEKEFTHDFTASIDKFRREIKRCITCYNISDQDCCSICNNKSRNQSVICVVESIRDVMAIEETGHFQGLYHVLGGVISPIDGIGPETLNINGLISRVDKGGVNELIMAISPTIEGETTIYYLTKQMEGKGLIITQIARGVAFGGDLELADEVTLGRSIATRTPYEMNR